MPKRKRLEGGGTIRCLYPIPLSLAYDSEVRGFCYGPTFGGEWMFSLGGAPIRSAEMLASSMRTNHLSRSGRRGSSRYIPRACEIMVHITYGTREYTIPWTEFIRGADVTSTFVEVTTGLCTEKRQRMDPSLEGGTGEGEGQVTYVYDEANHGSDGTDSEDEIEGIDYPEEESSNDSSDDYLPGQSDNIRSIRVVPKRERRKGEENSKGIQRREFDFRSFGECTICGMDSEKTLWIPSLNRPGSLVDLGRIGGRNLLEEDVLIVNPCNDLRHTICIRCAKHILLNRDRCPLGRRDAAVRCFCSPVKGFGTVCESFYQSHHFEWILNREDMDYVRELYDVYATPGYETIPCPLLVRGNPCGFPCLVSYDDIDHGASGRTIVRCTRNPKCMGTFCYHCRISTPRTSSTCNSCLINGERNCPNAYNRYFYDPDFDRARRGANPRGFLLRNGKVTEDIAVSQIQEVLRFDRLSQKCFDCGVLLSKTTQCNSLSHCGIQKCYVCGRNCAKGGMLESSHWDPTGTRGCPRFDCNSYWRKMIRSPFLCQEDACYSDHMECVISDHQEGIRAMHEERKFRHVIAMVRSMRLDLADAVMRRLEESNGDDSNTMKLLTKIRNKFTNNK